LLILSFYKDGSTIAALFRPQFARSYDAPDNMMDDMITFKKDKRTGASKDNIRQL